MENNLTPLTNEDLAMYYMANQNSQREFLNGIMNTFKEVTSNILTAMTDRIEKESKASKLRYDTILSTLTDQNKALADANKADRLRYDTILVELSDKNDMLTSALNQTNTVLGELSNTIKKSNNANIGIKNEIKDEIGNVQKAIADALKHSAISHADVNITSPVTKPVYSIDTFKFSSALNGSQQNIWRASIKREVDDYIQANKMDFKRTYHSVYAEMSDMSGMSIWDLFEKNRNELRVNSKLAMISRSDYLRKCFITAWYNIKHPTHSSNTARKFSSIDVNKCPELMWELAKKYSGTTTTRGGWAFQKLYSLYDTVGSVNEAVKYVRNAYGYKNVNRAFAIMNYPGGYQTLKKLVDAKVADKQY